jgi:hypothetical protein
MTFRISSWLILGMSVLFAGCSGSAPPPVPFKVELGARSDDGEPIAGALFTSGTKRLGTTDARGVLERAIPGTEGQTLPVGATCPEGYEGPKGPLSVRLSNNVRSVGATGPKPTRLDVTCKRKTRQVVVVVHAPGGADLPVLVEGVAANTVNPDGSAHVLVEVDTSVKSLAVTLDTSARRDLVPKNPRRLFDLDGGDALLVMDQTFHGQARPKQRVVSDPRPRRHIPTRVD